MSEFLQVDDNDDDVKAMAIHRLFSENSRAKNVMESQFCNSRGEGGLEFNLTLSMQIIICSTCEQ